VGSENYTVGVLVMSNYGRRRRLTINGIPAGDHFIDLMPEPGTLQEDAGSAIVIVATDAPLQGQDLARLTKRASFGLVRTGSTGSNGSGEIALAFSTGRPGEQVSLLEIGMRAMDGLFEAALDATEEAVLNSLCMAMTTVGRGGNTVHAVPLDRLAALLSSRR
jgi:D-aminopeptidase